MLCWQFEFLSFYLFLLISVVHFVGEVGGIKFTYLTLPELPKIICLTIFSGYWALWTSHCWESGICCLLLQMSNFVLFGNYITCGSVWDFPGLLLFKLCYCWSTVATILQFFVTTKVWSTCCLQDVLGVQWSNLHSIWSELRLLQVNSDNCLSYSFLVGHLCLGLWNYTHAALYSITDPWDLLQISGAFSLCSFITSSTLDSFNPVISAS